jgi:hypothetical protein
MHAKVQISVRYVGGSSVGIGTVYGLGGRGSFPSRGRDFLYSTASRSALGPTQPPIHWILGALSRK